ncbi:MAG: hypothetical protein J5724_03185 [Ruminococcus sp.]|uniref:hypothetical protein n=1 Tax=Ruminococcus sp. TaxID=41978 RepID=UPI001B72C804|nr:hypothetical protein [Ruminococcus sp.]MBO4493373.1 hypothetical protein [Ruminococcus sp.]MBP5433098.1 hypothetical protein [Ruminococcus sp.]
MKRIIMTALAAALLMTGCDTVRGDTGDSADEASSVIVTETQTAEVSETVTTVAVTSFTVKETAVEKETAEINTDTTAPKEAVTAESEDAAEPEGARIDPFE